MCSLLLLAYSPQSSLFGINFIMCFYCMFIVYCYHEEGLVTLNAFINVAIC